MAAACVMSCDPVVSVREAAVDALGYIGGIGESRVMQALMARIYDEATSVRIRACHALR